MKFSIYPVQWSSFRVDPRFSLMRMPCLCSWVVRSSVSQRT